MTLQRTPYDVIDTKRHDEDQRLALELYNWGQALLVNNNESDPDFDAEYEHYGGLSEDLRADGEFLIDCAARLRALRSECDRHEDHMVVRAEIKKLLMSTIQKPDTKDEG